MKLSPRLLFSDKVILVTLVLSAVCLLAVILMSLNSGKLRTENEQLTLRIQELQSLTDDVIFLKKSVLSKERRINIRKSSGVTSAIEEILTALGMEASALKPLPKKRTGDFMEEEAELEINTTDLNSIVNLLYKIEHSPYPLKLKNTQLKTTFEAPDRFIVNVSVSLLSKA